MHQLSSDQYLSVSPMSLTWIEHTVCIMISNFRKCSYPCMKAAVSALRTTDEVASSFHEQEGDFMYNFNGD